MDEREKRHARQFEPPPWEQEAFEKLERLKAEREQEAALDEALAAVRAPAEEVPAEAVSPTAERTTVDEGDAGSGQQEAGARGVSTAELETMLIGLKRQEPVIMKSYTVIANVVSALLVAGGIGFVIWAAVLFAKVGPDAGATPTLASMLLMVWGFLLVGGAGLLYKKYNLT